MVYGENATYENIFIEDPKVSVRDYKDTPDVGVTCLQSVKNQCTGFIKVSLTSVEKTGDTAFYRLYYCLLDYRFIDFIAISVADEHRRFIFLDHFSHHKKSTQRVRAEKHIARLRRTTISNC